MSNAADGIASDWDTMAMDECGLPSNGVTETSPCGVRIEPFFNMLQVYHKTAWQKGSISPEPIVLTLRSGEFAFLDVHVLAERGPQDGIYYVTWFGEPGSEKVSLGCAVGGWLDYDGDRRSTYFGVMPAAVSWLRGLLELWSKQARIPEFLAKTPLTEARRFNQGDLFLTRQAGFELPHSAPGAAQLPLLFSGLPQSATTKPKENQDVRRGTHGTGNGRGPGSGDVRQEGDQPT